MAGIAAGEIIVVGNEEWLVRSVSGKAHLHEDIARFPGPLDRRAAPDREAQKRAAYAGFARRLGL